MRQAVFTRTNATVDGTPDITATATIYTAIECMELGAFDILLKSIGLAELSTIVQKAYEMLMVLNSTFSRSLQYRTACHFCHILVKLFFEQ
jgi:DNA-binding NtrC family response regulator